jgi:serine/threonine-protein kinase HipA
MELVVSFRGQEVGRLLLHDQETCFTYSGLWLSAAHRFPLSVSLPLGPERLCGDLVRNFFANLLPEGDVRERVARKLGISRNNLFGLLLELGGDCAGAISLFPPDVAPGAQEIAYQPLTEDELAEVVAELPQRPLLAGERGIRLSLAGAQDKLPVRYDGTIVSLPRGGAPSTHILKPPIRGIEGSVTNEAFCMRLAAATGLDVPGVTILRTGEVRSLLVERYDRALQKGDVLRIHQEDFCQALGVSPEIKYQAEGGPSLKECCALLRRYSASPAKDLLRLTEWVFFNVLIGNADAHAKNISLMYRNKAPVLAPFYDLLCTRVYVGLSNRLAMKLGGENRFEWIMERHWSRFAEEAGVKPRTLHDNLRAFCERAGRELDRTLASFSEENGTGDEALTARIAEHVRSTIADTVKRLSGK